MGNLVIKDSSKNRDYALTNYYMKWKGKKYNLRSRMIPVKVLGGTIVQLPKVSGIKCNIDEASFLPNFPKIYPDITSDKVVKISIFDNSGGRSIISNYNDIKQELYIPFTTPVLSEPAEAVRTIAVEDTNKFITDAPIKRNMLRTKIPLKLILPEEMMAFEMRDASQYSVPVIRFCVSVTLLVEDHNDVVPVIRPTQWQPYKFNSRERCEYSTFFPSIFNWCVVKTKGFLANQPFKDAFKQESSAICNYKFVNLTMNMRYRYDCYSDETKHNHSYVPRFYTEFYINGKLLCTDTNNAIINPFIHIYTDIVSLDINLPLIGDFALNGVQEVIRGNLTYLASVRVYKNKWLTPRDIEQMMIYDKIKSL